MKSLGRSIHKATKQTSKLPVEKTCKFFTLLSAQQLYEENTKRLKDWNTKARVQRCNGLVLKTRALLLST